MSDILFDFQFLVENLDDFLPQTESCEDVVFGGKLIVEGGDTPNIEIRTFDSENRGLGMKLLSAPTFSLGEKVGHQIEVYGKSNHRGDIAEIDFSESRMATMRVGTGMYDEGRSYFAIWLDRVRLVFNDTENRDKQELESTFYLTDSAISVIDRQYSFLVGIKPRSPVAGPNQQNERTKFGQVEFVTEFNFFRQQKEDGLALHIRKESKLVLHHGKLDEETVLAHGSALCALLSFYINREIRSCWSVVNTRHSRITHCTTVQLPYKSDPIGVFFGELPQDFCEVVQQVDSEVLLKNHEAFETLVDRYNLALQSDGVTRFMLLYSILEQVRSHLIAEGRKGKEGHGISTAPASVRNEFDFTVVNPKRDKAIRQAIRSLSEIVSPYDKQEFEDSVAGKASAIKYRTMTHQFDSLMQHCGLKVEDFGLDFSKMKAIRDKVFHGEIIPENDDELNYINRRLHRLSGTVLWYWIGVDVRPQKK